jgi:hypothetical protein
MARQSRSVRVDEGLLVELESLARDRAVPETFAGQVDAGLRLLVAGARTDQLRRSAQLVAAEGPADELFGRFTGGAR